MIRESGDPTSARRKGCLAGVPPSPLREGLTKTIPYFEELLAQQRASRKAVRD